MSNKIKIPPASDTNFVSMAWQQFFSLVMTICIWAEDTRVKNRPNGYPGLGGNDGFKIILRGIGFPIQNFIGSLATVSRTWSFPDKTGTVALTSDAVNLKNYTVATLPAGVRGNIVYVTDALAPTYLAAVAGGGAVVTPCFYNGAAWVTF